MKCLDSTFVARTALCLRRVALIIVAALAFGQAAPARDNAPAILFQQSLGAPDRGVEEPVFDDYLLSPLDKISVNVFGQKALSVEKVQLDASGQIVLPLVGAIKASGRTAADVSEEISQKLGERYLQSPQVSVLIDEAVGQRITVFGAVMESGVYTLKGPTTLVQAIALAKGPDPKLANLRRVAVFRRVDGMRAAALFDVKAIRDGKAIDPEVYGGDTVIVQGSGAKAAWREFQSTLPGLGLYTFF